MTLLFSSEAAWRRSKVTLAVQHDVLRLQVSVDDALLVQVAQSHGDLRQVKTTHNTQHTTHVEGNLINSQTLVVIILQTKYSQTATGDSGIKI